jgi:hypothetical protein
MPRATPARDKREEDEARVASEHELCAVVRGDPLRIAGQGAHAPRVLLPVHLVTATTTQPSLPALDPRPILKRHLSRLSTQHQGEITLPD